MDTWDQLTKSDGGWDSELFQNEIHKKVTLHKSNKDVGLLIWQT